MSSLRRGIATAIAAVAVVSTLTACGSSSESKANSDYAPVSNTVYNPVNGISLDSTVVKVRNLYVVAALGAVPPRIRMTMVNTTGLDDALVGATIGVPGVSGRLFGGVAGAVPVVRGSTVLVGSGTAPQITFRGAPAPAGTWVRVTLLFRNGRAVTGSALVQNPTSQFSDGTLPQSLG